MARWIVGMASSSFWIVLIISCYNKSLCFWVLSSSMTISCTPEKVLRLQDFCSKLLTLGRCTVLSREKLIGTIQSVSPAVPYADLFYRSLQGNRCKLTLPEPSCGSSPPSLEPSSSKTHDLQSVLSNHLSGGTKSGYKCSYNKFVFLLSFSQCKSNHLWTYNNCSILEAIIWWWLFIQFC